MGAFGRLVDHLLGAANRQQVSADPAVQNLVTGQTDNLHGVMLAVAQADLALRMVVEVRNRLTEAFQEVMRMQM
jgi:flagellar hook-basal body complex protein FliE